MRKLSQKELLHEGFWSGVARVAGQAAKGAAKVIVPKTTALLGKGAELAAGAIENIRSGNPVASVKTFLGSEEGKRQFKGVNLNKKEELLANGDYKILITGGTYINNLGGGKFEDKDLSGGFLIVRQKERPGGAGFDNTILEVHDKNGKLNKKPINAGASKPEAGGKPASRPRTGGKKKGELSQTPSAIKRRQKTAARRAEAAGLSVSAPATKPSATKKSKTKQATKPSATKKSKTKQASKKP